MPGTPSLQPMASQILQWSVFSWQICTLPIPFHCNSHLPSESRTEVLLNHNNQCSLKKVWPSRFCSPWRGTFWPSNSWICSFQEFCLGLNGLGRGFSSGVCSSRVCFCSWNLLLFPSLGWHHVNLGLAAPFPLAGICTWESKVSLTFSKIQSSLPRSETISQKAESLRSLDYALWPKENRSSGLMIKIQRITAF